MKWAALISLLGAACGRGGADPTVGSLGLQTFTDINPDPDIVEINLIATTGQVEYLPGKTAAVWVYRDGSAPSAPDQVPGPMIVAKQGDRVIVHFTNQLPDATSVHWHGLRLPAAMDGSTATQTPVPPGGTFTYDFIAQDSGSFWYHSHVQEDVQIERGLQAPFLVTGGVDPDVSADRYFVIDDVKLNADGTLSQATNALDIMMGRQGNVLLVNGQKEPTLTVAANGRERWRFVNSANGRYFNLALPGKTFLVIGWDGGLLPQPYQTDTLLIAPGERYEVLVDFTGNIGDSLTLQTLFYDRGHNMPDPGPQTLMQVELGRRQRTGLADLPTTWRTIDPLPVTSATLTRPFALTETDDGTTVVFAINGESWPYNQAVMVKQNDLEVWEIDNQADMDHPFHLHGMFFQVLDRNGVPETQLGWKDTVNVQQRTKTHFAVRYDAQGMWMFHCHILEHAERGMMGDLMVMP